MGSLSGLRILITGASGMLGSMLSNYLGDQGAEVIATDINQLDITDVENIHQVLDEYNPTVLINSAAYTNVDGAEDDIVLSNLVNGTAVGYLAKASYGRDIKFLHISTDYVFGDNSKKGYREDTKHRIDAPNQYGRSKYLGEVEALRNNKDSYILRTSWIFGPNGRNFVDTMIRLGRERDDLSIVVDEVGVPTFTRDISRQIEYILANGVESGVYHIVNEGACSRYDLAQEIFDQLGIHVKSHEIELKDFPRKAIVPNYSILINTKLPKLQKWQSALGEYLDMLK